MELNIKKILSLLKLIDAGLQHGAGNADEPGEFCIQQAVTQKIDLRSRSNSDHPTCVSEVVRNFGVILNDSVGWESDAARAKGLREFAVAELGSNEIDCSGFTRLVNKELEAKKSRIRYNEERLVETNDNLCLIASAGVSALKKLGSPGCKYLNLCHEDRVKLGREELAKQHQGWAASFYEKESAKEQKQLTN